MRDIIRVFKALSDETRLRILNVLQERECCVCEVMQVLNISQTRASRNLAELYDAGILKLRKDEQWSVYSLDKEGMKGYLNDIVQAAARALEKSKLIQSDREHLKKVKRVGLNRTEKLHYQKVLV